MMIWVKCLFKGSVLCFVSLVRRVRSPTDIYNGTVIADYFPGRQCHSGINREMTSTRLCRFTALSQYHVVLSYLFERVLQSLFKRWNEQECNIADPKGLRIVVSLEDSQKDNTEENIVKCVQTELCIGSYSHRLWETMTLQYHSC